MLALSPLRIPAWVNSRRSFFNKCYEDELGSVKGHFGPINCVDFSYDGMSFATGSEDGYARIHHLPSGYVEVVDT